MFVYWFLFLVLAIGALLNRSGDPERSPMLFVFLAALPATLMIGLRWKVGTEYIVRCACAQELNVIHSKV